MSIKLKIHSLLCEYTDGHEMLEVNGNTIGHCLEQLVSQFPRIKEMLFSHDGKLLRSTQIYINDEEVYLEELAQPVKDGDTVIVLMLTGCVG